MALNVPPEYGNWPEYGISALNLAIELPCSSHDGVPLPVNHCARSEFRVYPGTRLQDEKNKVHSLRSALSKKAQALGEAQARLAAPADLWPVS